MGAICQIILSDYSKISLGYGKCGFIITGNLKPIAGTVKIQTEVETEYKYIALSLIKKDDGLIIHTKNEIEKIYFLYNVTDGNITLATGKYEYPFKFITPDVPPVDKRIGVIKYELVVQFKNPGRLSLSKTFKETIIILPQIKHSIQMNS